MQQGYICEENGSSTEVRVGLFTKYESQVNEKWEKYGIFLKQRNTSSLYIGQDLSNYY